MIPCNNGSLLELLNDRDSGYVFPGSYGKYMCETTGDQCGIVGLEKGIELAVMSFSEVSTINRKLDRGIVFAVYLSCGHNVFHELEQGKAGCRYDVGADCLPGQPWGRWEQATAVYHPQS